MGTRAVVRANLEPFNYGKDIFIATHWDGMPDSLGQDLVKKIKKNLRKGDPKNLSVDLGGSLQEAVFEATASHHIDTVSTIGEEEFNEKYGDWAEYVYRITPDGGVQYTEASGAWGGFLEDAQWKDIQGAEKVEEIVQAAKNKDEERLKELV